MLTTQTEAPFYADAPARELPRYISQKPVWALCISRVELRAADFHLLHPVEAGYGPIEVSDEWLKKHQAEMGGFYVQYGDGYASYSPAIAFRGGNTPAHQWGIPRSQEPKYTVGERGRLVNRDSGKPIPDEEPVFIFRAQDRWAAHALQAYALMVTDPQQRNVILERVADFEAYGFSYPDRLKEPDTAHTVAHQPV
jgi:hypothetical protein